MKIMQFNIQHGAEFYHPEKRINLPLVASVIKRFDPDIVSLNEVRGIANSGPADPTYTNQTEQLSLLTGMTGYFAPAINIKGKGLYGNALLTKFPILRSVDIPVPSPRDRYYNIHRYEDRCLLKAELDVNGKTVTVLSCHMGLNDDERVSAVVTICSELEKILTPVILMGDFNMPPDNTILDPIRARLRDVSAGFACEKCHTFPTDKPRTKIDYIFVSKDFEIINADIPGISSSDHLPHTGEIRLK
ncbi:MAG: endonuclease/exonuclease/phosphatase family protein [Clostridia bacterium]|nr:endonuclease/exonuclease/phosphatase family protein [Clostridia bacterium]